MNRKLDKIEKKKIEEREIKERVAEKKGIRERNLTSTFELGNHKKKKYRKKQKTKLMMRI